MTTKDKIGFSVQDTSGEYTSCEMDSGCEMTTKDKIGFSVQDTSGESIRCEMMTKDKIGFSVQDTSGKSIRAVAFFPPAARIIEETEPSTSRKSDGSKPTHSGENNAITADNCKYENDAINIDITLQRRTCHLESGGDRQENMELSCLNSKASEAFEDTSRTEDTSMRLDDITMSCVLENSASIAPLSRYSTAVGLEEDNFAPKGSIRIETKLLETDHNGNEGSRPSDGTFAYHEVNKNLSSASHIDGNASNLKTNDNTNSDAYSTTTYSELQDVADMDKNKDTEQENKTSTELQHDNNIKEIITSVDHRTMILKSENSTTKSHEDDSFETEIHISTNIANDLLELEHNGEGESRPNDDILAHHDVNNGYSAASRTGGNASDIKTDVSSNTDANSTTTNSKLQGGATMSKNNATDPENKTSTDPGRDSVDFACHGQNIKEEKSKAFNSTSPNDNSSTCIQLDNNITKVIKLNDHTTTSDTTMILKSENSTAAGFEEDNFAPESHGSNNIFTALLESKHIGDMGSRPSDDLFAQHEVNSGFSAGTQTGRNASIQFGCNQSTNSFKTDEDTYVDAYPRRKRSNLNCKLSIDHNPKDNISSSYGRDNKDLSTCKLNSQDQTQAITKSPNALAPISATYFQQDVEVSDVTNLDDPVSLPWGAKTRSPCESKMDKRNYSRISSSVYKFLIFLMIVLLVVPGRVQASLQWQLYHFNITKRNVIHQYLTVMNTKNRDSPGCTFNVTALPFWYNCTQSGNLIFVYNETHIEMATKDLSTTDYSLEYGNGLNGHNLLATRGERLDDKSIEDKIAGITKATGSTPQARTPQGTDPIVWIIVGVGVGLLAFIAALVSLYIFCRSFRRWVQSFVSSCRRRKTNNVPEPEADRNLEMEPLASPITNGSVDGHLGKEEKD